MRSFWAVLTLTSAFVFSGGPATLRQSEAAQTAPTGTPRVVAAITVKVTARAGTPARAKGRPAIKLVNGKPMMRLTAKANGQTIEAPQGTYILLRFGAESGAVGFTVTPPGILQTPRGVYHLPSGAIGLLRAVHTGTAKVTVQGVRPRKINKIIHGSEPNWSGYAKKGGPFVQVSGEWTVPAVHGQYSNPALLGQYSSTWIGIDGDGDDSLIQTGTDQAYSVGILGLGRSLQYSAWWEVVPGDTVQIPHPVSAGDHMVAVISLNGNPTPGSPMDWVIFMMDQTKNWTYLKHVTYSGELKSAEWIEERPTVCILFSCFYTTLADYGKVSFDSYDTLNALSPAFSPSESITLTEDGHAYSTPSDPDADKDGFTLAYGAQRPPPPGPFISTTSLPQAYLNIPYKASLTVTGDAFVRWFGSNLPSWLALNENTGVLSGTPPAPGVNSFSVVARDADDQNVSSQVQSLALTVQATPPPPDFSLSAAPQAVHLAYSGGSCSGSTAITVNPRYGFNAPVQLSATGPGVASAQFSPASTTGTSSLTIHANFCAATGSLDTLVTVTGASGGLTHSTAVDLVPLSSSICRAPDGRKLQNCP